MRIAMVGTRGIPARYGGFETAVEEIGARLASRGHEVVVYSRGEKQHGGVYRGIKVIHVPSLPSRQLETLSHTAFSVLHCLTRRTADVALVFNAANAPYIALLQAMRVPVAVNVDGLEWRRAKWAGAGARYYRWAERVCAQHACILVADSTAIASYMREVHDVDSTYIPYGAMPIERIPGHLTELGLEQDGYHLVVARFEPENHVLEIVKSYAASNSRLPLVVVGDAPYSHDYVARVLEAGAKDARVRFLGSIWDQELLNQLYASCCSYVHGHSVGGTNPSLLRAIGAGAPVTAVDVPFNREVARSTARYFDPTKKSELSQILVDDETHLSATRARGSKGRQDVLARYRWEDVADRYESVCQRLANWQSLDVSP